MIQFIIFGTMGVPWTVDTGQFNCPQCGTQGYRLRQVRRFFTLYFIPLIPLDVIGRYVRCDQCSTDYEEAVLSFNPEAIQQSFIEDLKRVMILMAVSDGQLDSDETAAIQGTFFDMTGNHLSESEIGAEAQMAMSSNTELAAYVTQIANDLADEGRIAVVQAAFNVASAGGSMTPGRQEQLMKLPMALGITQEDFKLIIDHVSRQE